MRGPGSLLRAPRLREARDGDEGGSDEEPEGEDEDVPAEGVAVEVHVRAHALDEARAVPEGVQGAEEAGLELGPVDAPELVKLSMTKRTITPSVVQRRRKVCRPTPTSRMPAAYSQDIAHTPPRPWSTRWKTGPAKRCRSG